MDHIPKGFGVEVPASATATASRQPPMVSGTLETDNVRSGQTDAVPMSPVGHPPPIGNVRPMSVSFQLPA
jgi:hypothetical protein